MMNFFVMGLGAVLLATILLAGRTRSDAPRGYRHLQAWGERKRRRGFKPSSRKPGVIVKYRDAAYRVQGNGAMVKIAEK